MPVKDVSVFQIKYEIDIPTYILATEIFYRKLNSPSSCSPRGLVSKTWTPGWGRLTRTVMGSWARKNSTSHWQSICRLHHFNNIMYQVVSRLCFQSDFYQTFKCKVFPFGGIIGVYFSLSCILFSCFKDKYTLTGPFNLV